MNYNNAKLKARSAYYTVFQMFCENDVYDRFKRLKEKLKEKNLMFKFDGSKYAVFGLDVENMTQLTDYTLTLEQLEDFAEKA